MPWESHQAKTDQDKQTNKQNTFPTKDGERSEDAVPSSAQWMNQWIEVKMLSTLSNKILTKSLERYKFLKSATCVWRCRVWCESLSFSMFYFHFLLFNFWKKSKHIVISRHMIYLFFSRELFVAKDVATWGDGELCTSTKPERPGANSSLSLLVERVKVTEVLLQIGPFFFSKIHLFIQFFWGVTWLWLHYFHQCRSVSLILVFVSSSTTCHMSRMPSPFAFVGCALIHHSLWTGRMELQ